MLSGCGRCHRRSAETRAPASWSRSAGVSRFASGDHVVASFVAACGQCRWCASGMEYLCDKGSGTLTPGMPTYGTVRQAVDRRNLGHLAKIGAFAGHTPRRASAPPAPRQRHQTH
ncbi:alcohol dehydrogenase catalytic domain-containing protein [Mycobacterium riyadhense]|uniref:alcohol dehydrogenase catalytic domain-containing protein n=1 Tax=Mycobacterium riyadhense TaxID=486698 RepID=UPI001EF9F3E0|nr:alcohol dehydrogenase catalytic domain-containing protein [Mycobacterium riyadhense]